jgi:hypothetical protein
MSGSQDVALALRVVGDAGPLPGPVTRGETVTLQVVATDRASGALHRRRRTG